MQHNKTLCGHIDEKSIVHIIMTLHLDERKTVENLADCLREVKWPSFFQKAEWSPFDIICQRREHLLGVLPFHCLQTNGVLPEARDGHAAVAFPEDDSMTIVGGNTAKGHVSDVWKLDVSSGAWERMSNVPGEPRFSFSAHPWDSNGSRFIVIFGGGNRRPFPMHGDLQLLDVKANEWHALRLPSRVTVQPRCRYASTWSVDKTNGTATMHVLGGHDEKGKRKDAHKVVLKHEEGSIPQVCTCEKMKDLAIPVHRAHAFQMSSDADGGDKRICMTGGLGTGNNLRRIHIAQGPEQGNHSNAWFAWSRSA